MRKYREPGMRRVRLVLWFLFNRTPLELPIDESAERAAAKHCKMSWDLYLAYRARYPELWAHRANRREEAKRMGSFPQMPVQFLRYRKITAPARSSMRKPRPRFTEWAGRKLLASREYKRPWLRQRIQDRLFARLLGM